MKSQAEMNQELLRQVEQRNLVQIRELLNSGADINACDLYNGSSVLSQAVSTKNPDLVEELIMRGADINHRFAWNSPAGGGTVFFLATKVSLWNKDVFRLLVQHKADVTVRDQNEESPLDNAGYIFAAYSECFSGGIEVATLLLQHKASVDIDKKDVFDASPYELARKACKTSLLKLYDDEKAKLSEAEKAKISSKP